MAISPRQQNPAGNVKDPTFSTTNILSDPSCSLQNFVTEKNNTVRSCDATVANRILPSPCNTPPVYIAKPKIMLATDILANIEKNADPQDRTLKLIEGVHNENKGSVIFTQGSDGALTDMELPILENISDSLGSSFYTLPVLSFTPHYQEYLSCAETAAPFVIPVHKHQYPCSGTPNKLPTCATPVPNKKRKLASCAIHGQKRKKKHADYDIPREKKLKIPTKNDIPGNQQQKARERSKVISSIQAPDLPLGWVLEVRARNSGRTKGHRDRYWYSPVTQKKFRSKVEINIFLEFLAVKSDEDVAFTFFKQHRQGLKASK